jgi:phosphonoacetaldehyde hydrolase
MNGDMMRLLNSAALPRIDDSIELKAVILDWAGTTVDFGSLAPMRTLERVFAAKGVVVTNAEIRAYMGWPKRVQIGKMLEFPRVNAAWKETHGKAPTERDADDLYENFIPLQTECLLEYSKVLPGIPKTVEEFRRRGLKIGTTTGYTREMMGLIVESAAKEGYIADCTLTPGEVGSGRPHPYMIYENAVRLQVYPMAAIVKVGDTISDIHEGLNAGCWSVGVVATGNQLGLSAEEFAALSAGERETRLNAVREELTQAGAHYVVDSVSDLAPVLDAIQERLKAGVAKELVV